MANFILSCFREKSDEKIGIINEMNRRSKEKKETHRKT